MARLTVSTANGICIDCGCFFSRKRRLKIRCNECVASRSREKHRGYAEKIRRREGMPELAAPVTCRSCPATFVRTAPKHYYCEDCRAALDAPIIGAPMNCAVCNSGFTRTGATQKHCKPCAIELRRLRSIEKNKRTDHAAVYLRVKDKVSARSKTLEGRAVRNAANQKRRLNPREQLRDRVSAMMRNSLHGKGGRSWETMVDYTREELVRHIERQFLPGMSWETFGPDIHIDHILPVSSFNFETADDPEFKACWALTNLRPLWAVDNVKKSDKVLYLL